MRPAIPVRPQFPVRRFRLEDSAFIAQRAAAASTSTSAQRIKSPLEIIQDALRTAVLAKSDLEALDVAGAALLRLADLVRAEVLHG